MYCSETHIGRRAVHRQLSRGHRVNRGHELLDQAELFVHHLGQRCLAAGRARGSTPLCQIQSALSFCVKMPVNSQT